MTTYRGTLNEKKKSISNNDKRQDNDVIIIEVHS